jgi:hypothetical protein
VAKQQQAPILAGEKHRLSLGPIEVELKATIHVIALLSATSSLSAAKCHSKLQKPEVWRESRTSLPYFCVNEKPVAVPHFTPAGDSNTLTHGQKRVRARRGDHFGLARVAKMQNDRTRITGIGVKGEIPQGAGWSDAANLI